MEREREGERSTGSVTDLGSGSAPETGAGTERERGTGTGSITDLGSGSTPETGTVKERDGEVKGLPLT
jgi:hypothetical protein